MLRKLAIVLAIVAMAANSFAAATVVTTAISTDATWAAANIKFTPSKSVILAYLGGTPADATGASNSVYAIAAKNTAGDSAYAATSASTSIVFTKALLAGVPVTTDSVPTLPTDASDSTISGGAGGWSVL